MPAHSPAPISEVLERLKNWEADERETPLPANIIKQELKPPSYGGPQRDAIASIVDGVVDDFCHKVQALRGALDKIEQEALQSAAGAKGSLNDHISVCARLNDELERVGDVVAQIQGRAK